MENKGSLLNKSSIQIIPNLSLNIPTVGEILEDEDAYYSITSELTATPFQCMVQLDDMGIDYTKISEWELFRIFMIRYSKYEAMLKLKIKELEFKIKNSRSSTNLYDEYCKQLDNLNDALEEEKNNFNLIFKSFDLTGEINGNIVGFDEYEYTDTKEIILYNPATKVEINQLVYNDLTDNIRKINLYEKVKSKPGNENAKKYLLEKERKKQKRNAKKAKEHYLEKMVIALVNTSEFPYNYETCMNLSIYTFNQSFKQIQHKIAFDNTMIGVYAGTIDTSSMSNKDDLFWISK